MRLIIFIACFCLITASGCVCHSISEPKTSTFAEPLSSETPIVLESAADLERLVGHRVRLLGGVSELKFGVVVHCQWMRAGTNDFIHVPEEETFKLGKWPQELLTRQIEFVGVLDRTPPFEIQYPPISMEDLRDPKTGIVRPFPGVSRSAGSYPGDFFIHNIWFRLVPVNPKSQNDH